jgi:hypothetical protein
VKLAKMMFEKFGWHFHGKVVPTPKVSRKDQDVLFHKQSKGAIKTIPQGCSERQSQSNLPVRRISTYKQQLGRTINT